MKKLFTLILAAVTSIGLWAATTAPTGNPHSPGTTATVNANGRNYEVFFSNNGVTTSFLVGSNTSSTTQATSTSSWCNIGSSCGNNNNNISTAFTLDEFISNVKSSNNNKALRLQSTGVAEKAIVMIVNGYDSIAILGKSNDLSVYAEIWDGSVYGTSNALTLVKSKSASSHYKRSFALDNSKQYRLTIAYGTSGSTNKDFVAFSLCVPSTPSCSSPENALELSSDADEHVYAGQEITFSTTGGNGEDITIEGANSETISANKWIATTGEHTFTASQDDSEGNVCGGSSQIVIEVEECQAAASNLALSSDAAANVYVGDVITFSTTGGNSGAITIAGANSETILDGAWTATEGEHTFTASQAKNGYVCAQEDELVINVLPKTPVSAVTISGETSAIVGEEVTYTATAANATQYAWFVDGIDANTNAPEFTYTAVKGNHSIVCKARNDFNGTDEWIASNPIALTVTKLCGELIAFTAETGSENINKDITATGVIGGTAHQNTDKNGKIGGNGYYVSLTLAKGSFMTGDTVRVVSSTAYAKLHLFSDAGITTIAEKASPANDDYVILQKGASTIYLYRNSTDGSSMNPTVVSMSVKRPCEESNNANLAELTINGETIEAVNNVYSYTVAATVELSQVAVAFSLAHPLASADKESPFNVTVPAGGEDANTATITVTAEDGTKVIYTVSVAKAAAASKDATLNSLKIDGADVADFDAATLEYSKEYYYDYAAVPVVSAEANDANATVTIDQAEAVPGVATITVTAEDEETQQVYTINLTKEAVAPIIRAISTGNTTATVSGTIGGTSDKSTQGEKFGGKGNYWGLTLDGDNTFKAGDTLHVIISQAAQQGTIALYDDQDGANLIYDTETLGVVGDNTFVFPAAMDGKKTFYICRDKAETNKWNAFVTSISVKRKTTATAISNTSDAVKAQKRIENGQLVIEKNGQVFNAMGQIIR